MERCPLKLLQTAALKIRVSYQWGADGAERLLLFTVFPAPSFVSLSLFSHVFLERTVWGSVTDSSVMFMCHLSWLEERDERSGKHRRWWSTTVVCSRINALQFSFCSWEILHWVKNVHGLARALGIGHEQVLDHRLDLFYLFFFNRFSLAYLSCLAFSKLTLRDDMAYSQVLTVVTLILTLGFGVSKCLGFLGQTYSYIQNI